MIFESPSYFYFFIGLTICLLFQFRKSPYAFSFSSLSFFKQSNPSLKQRFVWLPHFLKYLSASLLITALARPQSEITNFEQAHEGVAMELILDVSSSMSFNIKYENKEEERLTVAKSILTEFIKGNGNDLKGRPYDLLGLIAFSRFPDTICPLTFSHESLCRLIETIEINDTPKEDGTAYGDAIALAAAKLESLGKKDTVHQKYKVKNKVIVLLTDGENNSGRHLPENAAELAKQWGIRIYSISIADDSWKSQDSGKIEYSEAEIILQKVSEASGGFFKKVSDYDSLKVIYSEIDQLEKSKIVEIPHIEYLELFKYFCYASIFCLLLAHLLKSTIFRHTP